jgi:hypothetical protein
MDCFSQTTKAQRYEIYKAKCNIIDTLTIENSGYLKIDTLILSTLPTKDTYYGKVIISSIKVSSTKSLIVVVDTVWTVSPKPLSYMFGNVPKTVTSNYDTDYRRWVYKNVKVAVKRCKPVTYTVWTKNENYYVTLLDSIEKYINDYYKK